ncbi:MAG: radical SAM protein [archaeon]|nr:radical SAM protein [archaeon]
MRICESFKSIQGEGKKIGIPTYFIRTVGCNLNCAWCDTQYASLERGTDIPLDNIMAMVGNCNDVCLTGGEPLLQKDTIELLERLLNSNKTIVLETNGSIDISQVPASDNIIISMDIKCPSSQMESKTNFSNIDTLREKDQLKFIINGGTDFDYSVYIIDKYKPQCESIFTPVGGMDIEPLAEEVIASDLNVRVLPQLHKIIWGNKRAV